LLQSGAGARAASFRFEADAASCKETDMKINALITLLAIGGSSSVAMARPITYSTHVEASWGAGIDRSRVDGRPRYDDRHVVVRDHRYDRQAPSGAYYNDRDYYQPQARPLGEALQFGDSEFRKDVFVSSQAGRFNTLRIENDGGRTYVMKIGVEFVSGEVQMIDVGRTLVGRQAMTFDLNGNDRAISRIFVYRDDGERALHLNWQHRGAFSVFAL
jgi:hypothetical protein